MPVRRIAAVSAAFIWATTAPAAEWVQDSRASRLEFIATYEAQAAPGRFRDFTTRLTFDPAQPEQGSLQVSIPMASADMDSADINRTIRATEWLDVIRYPRAEFQSARIQSEGGGQYVAQGRLTMKGVTRDIRVPFTWASSGRTATMAGRLELDRTSFHIGSGDSGVGGTIRREVAVSFNLHLRRAD